MTGGQLGEGAKVLVNASADVELAAVRELAAGVLDTYAAHGSAELATGDVDTLLAGVFVLLDQLATRTADVELRALTLLDRVGPLIERAAPLVEQLRSSKWLRRLTSS